MPTVINGSGTIAGIQYGGLQDGIITQAELGTNVVGTGPAFRVYQTVAQNVPNADTVISFDTKDFDTSNAFSTSTNRFQPQVAGYYHIYGNAQNNGTSTTWYCALYKNGSVQQYGVHIPVSNAGTITTLSGMVFLNGSTDYVDFRVASSVASPGIPTLPGPQRVSFGGCLIRAADVKPVSVVAPTTANGPTFRANRQTAQTPITNNSATKLLLTTKDWDTANCFDNTTNYRFQPNVAGYYQVNYAVFCDMASTVLQQVVGSIFKNGSVYGGTDLTAGSLTYSPTSPVNALTSSGADIVFLNGSTDYIELWGRVVVTSGTPHFDRAMMSATLVRLP